MKVEKVVISDEMPESCSDCNLWTEYWEGNYCNVAKKDLEDDWYDARPDWCPLVLMESSQP